MYCSSEFLYWPIEFLLRCYLARDTRVSMEMEEEIKRWTACRRSARVMEIIQDMTTVSEASRRYDLAPPLVRSLST